MQRNWISLSEGAWFFPVVGMILRWSIYDMADTLFGASYVVLAPEQLVDN